MRNKKGIEELSVRGKRVLVRCDFNVPMDKGSITDDARIQAALPSIEYLREQGARIILMSHLGRPKGEPKQEFSLAPVAERLNALLNTEVLFAADDNVVGEQARKLSMDLKDGQVMLLQNTRYRAEETKNGAEFAAELASLGELFVNDAFGTAHRAHASNVGVASLLPSALGYLVKKEVDIMGEVMEEPKRPFVAILGGAKVSDKIGVIENLLNKVDALIVGGGMAFTFLKAQGLEIGTSLLEEDKMELALELMDKAKEKKVRLLLPQDVIVAPAFSNEVPFEIVDADKMPADQMGLDIGPKSLATFAAEISGAKTVIWNGPMGVFEMENFSKGTFGVAQALADADAVTIIGGGDSAAAAQLSGLAGQMTHISTGGGASLEFFEGKVLPGIDAISER
jgi:phosphoglycerate kinase